MEQKVTKLFAYGNLKTGFLKYGHMRGSLPIGFKAITANKYKLIAPPPRYSASLFEHPKHYNIAGQLHAIKEDHLKALGKFESVPERRYRKLIEVDCVPTEDSVRYERHHAWCYFMHEAGDFENNSISLPECTALIAKYYQSL